MSCLCFLNCGCRWCSYIQWLRKDPGWMQKKGVAITVKRWLLKAEFCLLGDSEASPCPSGHYCYGSNGSDQDSLLAPQKCPPYTYRKLPGARSLTDCQPCPPGYHCPLSGKHQVKSNAFPPLELITKLPEMI